LINNAIIIAVSFWGIKAPFLLAGWAVLFGQIRLMSIDAFDAYRKTELKRSLSYLIPKHETLNSFGCSKLNWAALTVLIRNTRIYTAWIHRY
jgi:hypothetical protein